MNPKVEVVRLAPTVGTLPSPRTSDVAGHTVSPPEGHSRLPKPQLEKIYALARRERVPLRIARGEIEGGMPSHRWRKLHPDEAHRFERVYELIEKFPSLTLDGALSLVATGKDPAEYLARKARPSPKAQLLEGRRAISNAPVAAYLRRLIAERVEVSVAAGARVFEDVLLEDLPTQFRFEREGAVNKIEVVSMAARTAMSGYAPSNVDPVLEVHPVRIRDAPEARPVADPRPLAALIGQTVELSLRHGFSYRLPLVAAGAFDLLLGVPGQELLVPLHAILRWQTVAA
jgi:hypothetical protein